jgi:hypothetical protein
MDAGGRVKSGTITEGTENGTQTYKRPCPQF